MDGARMWDGVVEGWARPDTVLMRLDSGILSVKRVGSGYTVRVGRGLDSTGTAGVIRAGRLETAEAAAVDDCRMERWHWCRHWCG